MVYGFGSSYTARVPFALAVLRAALREAREAKDIGRDALATKIGRAKSTIQSAEMGPDVPGVDTVALIVEGLGLTLSDFFLQLESTSDGPRHVQNQSLQSGETLSDTAVSQNEREAAAHGGGGIPQIVLDPDALRDVGRYIGRAIRAAARDQQTATARPAKPKRSRGRTRSA